MFAEDVAVPPKPTVTPPVSTPSFGEMPTHWQEVWHYRYLLRNLVVRDLKVRYKSSALGILWSLLNPLLMMTVFWLVFKMAGNNKIRDYAIFALVGLMPWNFFAGSVVGGANAILTNAPLVKKVYFPRELLPTAIVLSNLVNFLIALIVLVIALYVTGIGLTWHALWVPIILFTQIIYTLGLAYFLSAVHLFFRDIAMILDVGMLAWFFLTPIFYSLEDFDSTIQIAGLVFHPARVMRWINPMASIIDGYRTVLWGTMGSSGPVNMGLDFFVRTFLTAGLTLVGGYLVFRRMEPYFGEKL